MKKLISIVVVAYMLSSVQLHSQVALGNGIDYNGGFIMRQHHVYLIWYGNWTGNTALTILPDLISGLDTSPYLNTLTTYGDSAGEIVANQMAFQGQVFTYYNHGNTL